MHTRKVSLKILIVFAFLLNACGTSSAIPPTATPLPPTATPVPPTSTMTPEPTSTLTPTPTPSLGSTMTSEKDGMVLIFVPAGEFTMGSKLYADERPPHQVDLSAYWIDKTEVTNEMFAKYLNDSISQLSIDPDDFMKSIKLKENIIYLLTCSTCSDKWTDRITWDGTKFSVASGYEAHPAVMVSWLGADSYCSWANRRLPTEAEWEKAAKGTDNRIYPWGDTMPDKTLANLRDQVGDTTEVGSYPAGASFYGLLDMAGNAAEWVNDWYSETYYQNSPSSNPLGPDTGEEKVVRGDEWDCGYYYCGSERTSARFLPQEPTTVGVGYGFRCAQYANP